MAPLLFLACVLTRLVSADTIWRDEFETMSWSWTCANGGATYAAGNDWGDWGDYACYPSHFSGTVDATVGCLCAIQDAETNWFERSTDISAYSALTLDLKKYEYCQRVLPSVDQL